MGWIHLAAAGTFYPTNVITSEAGSRTTSAGSSGLINASVTRITGVMLGPAHDDGSAADTLDFKTHAGVTIRSMSLNGLANNIANNTIAPGFTVPDGLQLVVGGGTGTTVDVYIDYEFQNSWV